MSRELRRLSRAGPLSNGLASSGLVGCDPHRPPRGCTRIALRGGKWPSFLCIRLFYNLLVDGFGLFEPDVPDRRPSLREGAASIGLVGGPYSVDPPAG